ncbi:Bacteriocin class IIc cyclic gassericin A-like [Alkalibacterium subtropicum]|uniref:Bacteriocin class IIc cyclic gassericin A-like n=1 Tax=Alkalibacterium subtropicum TaxID=753702 RepID=A0A1I1IC64_9LACT|nr:class IIc cyclic bacteriocin [Alkalibacterium subtropicum]SFC33814.1 Bacteriocin class IIc cyclic gassericin A-like [Alkalibacterium subtropicum]
MINLSKSIQLNKFEKIAMFAIFFTLLAAATANIIFVADLFGISITSDIVGQVWNYIEGGTGVATAISWALGVTIPAWAAPIVAAIGVVSA